MPLKFEIQRHFLVNSGGEMDGEAANLLFQEDEADLSLLVPADGFLQEGNAPLGQLCHGGLHILGLQRDVPVDTPAAVLENFEDGAGENVGRGF